MSDIENKMQSDNEKLVDDKRRSFTKAGIAAPVLMTLASRPVFGAQCLSDMISGINTSNPDKEKTVCAGGWGPDFWGTPNGGSGWKEAWEMSGFVYGTKGNNGTKKREVERGDTKKREIEERETKKRVLQIRETKAVDGQGNADNWEKYEGGTLYNSVFSEPADIDGRTLREILNGSKSSPKSSTESLMPANTPIFIAGLLNALYFAAIEEPGSPSSQSYIISVAEFWQLYNGELAIPNGTSLQELIEAGYKNG